MSVSIIIKWSGQEYPVTKLTEEDTVLDLKETIKTLTGVLPERQKLLGLKIKGKPAENDVKLGVLKLKPNTKIMMMGSREESLEEVLAPPPDNDDVINDFDIEEDVIEVENREENLAKIARRVKDYKVDILNPPREGKKLLVLDVDYTLFDHRSCAESGHELMRPYLHEFLTSAYEDYDIVIWSATSMKWIEVKMKELGVTTNSSYKITFMLDSAAMITVHTPKRGVVEPWVAEANPSAPFAALVEISKLSTERGPSWAVWLSSTLTGGFANLRVKPLGVIWDKFPEFYTRKNTIMFDDIGRNFLMNPQNGLKIRPFMKAHLNRDKDRELLKLSQYLKEIAKLDDFTDLNHKHWEKYLSKKQGQ
ncbi:ubiquitin-like domain-containing CTD phosphatase 1 isoform X2 [Callorhinchus milii]|nr:ubiquitin-like domain-containing CTD phosphatase 1 isoform X2 [Callorhinchus milii]XP_007889603.1 ubiquitin-like domain-containing CTD phosphatase 1 isoform X2 [Callorhinchus milii]|eukprot:gi/632948443/ref/XP_007889601.1/ PREDICTED: ubiquitin-like domain-containing CTD phosphatase 1 isoform X2 [Callorhinchus milii]